MRRTPGLESTPTKVTILSSLPPQRGVTPYTARLLDALAARSDVEVQALGFRSLYPRWLYPGGDQETSDAVELPVPERRILAWYNPWTWLWAGLTVRGDIIHAQWWSWFLAPAYVVVLSLCRLRGKRVVVTAHNLRPHEHGWWRRLMNALVLRTADEIIVHSERNRRALGVVGGKARVAVVPHGALALRAPTADLTREDARRRIGLPPDAKVVLCFGNVRPYKGIDVLLRASAAARASVPALRVIIAGELWKDCRDPAREAERAGVGDIVTCRLRYVPDSDAALLFAASDVVVLPYLRFDGQSGAGTLAATARRAIIVSDVGGLPDLVRDPGAVVAPSDPVALAAALIRVLSDDAFRRKLEADAEIVAAGLSWDGIADATVGVYQSALRPTPALAARATQ